MLILHKRNFNYSLNINSEELLCFFFRLINRNCRETEKHGLQTTGNTWNRTLLVLKSRLIIYFKRKMNTKTLQPSAEANLFNYIFFKSNLNLKSSAFHNSL